MAVAPCERRRLFNKCRIRFHSVRSSQDRPLAVAGLSAAKRPGRGRRQIAFDFTPGQLGDVRSVAGLVDKLPKTAPVMANTPRDSDKFREFLIARSSAPVIMPNPTRENVPLFDKISHKGRNVIEGAVPRHNAIHRPGAFAPPARKACSSCGGFIESGA